MDIGREIEVIEIEPLEEPIPAAPTPAPEPSPSPERVG